MMRRTPALFACMILCWISVPSRASEISCFNPANASGLTEPEWRAAGFLSDNEIPAWDDLPTMSEAEARDAGFVPEAEAGAAGFVPLCNGLLSGEISKGDYEKVVTFLDGRRPKMFALNSIGGDVDEALKIGHLFRKFLILTLVPTQPSD